MAMPDEAVTTAFDRNAVSASTIVDGEPEAVFDFLRRPANHALISGDHSVRGTTSGPEALGLGDRFGMRMRVGLPYRIRNKVVEFEENRRIAWCHPGGHRWRWQLEPEGEGRTRLTETFDMSTARMPLVLRLAGYPKRHEPNVSTSVANVAAHFSAGETR